MTPRIRLRQSRGGLGRLLSLSGCLIEQHGVRSVCEFGGGANPALDCGVIDARLDYTLLDKSGEELAKAPAGYRSCGRHAAAADAAPTGRFDLVFSRMLLEHVARRRAGSTATCWRCSSRGGLAFHFFPTLYCPPFVANRLMIAAGPQRLLDGAGAGDPVRAGKFPAYYSWCRGPSRRQIDRFARLGYELVRVSRVLRPRLLRRLNALRCAPRAAGRPSVAASIPCRV